MRERVDAVLPPPAPIPRSVATGDAGWHNAIVDVRGTLASGLRAVGRAVWGEDAVRAEKALAELRACAEALDRLPAPPTPRHERVAAALRRACAAAEAGARVDPERLVRDERLFRESLDAWGEAVDAFAAANGDFPRPFWNGHLPVVSAALPLERSRHDPILSSVGSDLMRLDVEVRCLSEDDWDALMEEYGLEEDVAGISEGLLIRIHPSICADLSEFVSGRRRPQDGDELLLAADAVALYAHELRHVRGDPSEARVECDALQRIEETAVALGASEEDAARLSAAYWEETYPLLPAEYRTPDCVEDGPLDDTPGDGEWP